MYLKTTQLIFYANTNTQIFTVLLFKNYSVNILPDKPVQNMAEYLFKNYSVNILRVDRIIGSIVEVKGFKNYSVNILRSSKKNK